MDTLLSGVVLWTDVGPVSFLIHIDDIARLLERYGVTAPLFADDVKVYLKITKPEDSVRLQKVLDVIATWTSDQQLSVSVSKCNIFIVGPFCCEANFYTVFQKMSHL